MKSFKSTEDSRVAVAEKIGYGNFGEGPIKQQLDAVFPVPQTSSYPPGTLLRPETASRIVIRKLTAQHFLLRYV
jgi:hypothetical protein